MASRFDALEKVFVLDKEKNDRIIAEIVEAFQLMMNNPMNANCVNFKMIGIKLELHH